MEHYCIHDPAGHPLAEVNESEEFQCDGCKTPGNGTRYRCHKCDFNFHDYCRRCPSTLSTFMHHQHHLELVTGPHPQASLNNHDQSCCDLCNDNVEGLFYRCKICDFDIHPLCTQLPLYVPHVLHPDHELMLHKSSPGWCRVCESECTSWRYGCRTCSFDIHLECILARCNVSMTTASRSVPPFYGPNFNTRYGPYGPGHYGADRPTHYDTYEPIHSGHYWVQVQYPYQSSTPHPHTHYGPYGPSLYGADRPTHYDAYEPTHSGHYGVQYPYQSSTPHPHTHYGPYGHSLTVSEAQGNGKPLKWGKRLGKIIFSLVTNLASGLLVGVIFGI